MRAGQHRDAGAGAGDDDYGRRGQDRREGAARGEVAAARARLATPRLTTL
jgi:hypothetical protein